MQKRATHLALGSLAALSVGIGAVSTVSAAASSGEREVSLSTARKAAGESAILPEKKKTPATPKATPKSAPAAAAKPKAAAPKILLSGTTKGSYFWDTGDSGNGDTGAPASGLPMQEGCFASPSWPMGTKGWIEYEGKRHSFFICDRGPGEPSHSGVMLDIDGITYAKLTGGKWEKPEVVGGDGQAGHITVTYHVTQWGDGPGKGAPKPF
jgi:hypothetical protein